jgi:hypothetical protein
MYLYPANNDAKRITGRLYVGSVLRNPSRAGYPRAIELCLSSFRLASSRLCLPLSLWRFVLGLCARAGQGGQQSRADHEPIRA